MSAPVHCIPAKADESNPAVRQAEGRHLAVELRQFAGLEAFTETDDRLFEEVGAVVEGEFHVEAAGESYDLVAGEGIIIPPGEPRNWRCDSPSGGVLYRVLVHDPARRG